MTEGIVEKGLRHVRTGQIDGPTVRRGLDQISDWFRSFHEEEGFFDPPIVLGDYSGVEDLIVTDYSFNIPRLKIARLFGAQPPNVFPIRVYNFPTSARYDVVVTPRDESYVPTSKYIEEVPNAIATFTGPTFRAPEQTENSDLPNNGFYIRSKPEDRVPFGHVPTGERRGAFAISSRGKMRVLDDVQKRRVMNSDMLPGHRALVGTSYFFLSADTIDNHELYVSKGKGNLSYLMQYQTEDGEEFTCFGVSKHMVMRRTMKDIFDDYLARVGGVSYIAVELELTHASCTTRGEKGQIEHFGGGGFYDRRDHYLVLPDDPHPTA